MSTSPELLYRRIQALPDEAKVLVMALLQTLQPSSFTTTELECVIRVDGLTAGIQTQLGRFLDQLEDHILPAWEAAPSAEANGGISSSAPKRQIKKPRKHEDGVSVDELELDLAAATQASIRTFREEIKSSNLHQSQPMKLHAVSASSALSTSIGSDTIAPSAVPSRRVLATASVIDAERTLSSPARAFQGQQGVTAASRQELNSGSDFINATDDKI